MTVMEFPASVTGYGRAVAAEVRAMLARRQVAGKDVAAALGVSPMYVSRRIKGDNEWTPSELAELAYLLKCQVSDLLPRLDSNQKPPGLWSSVLAMFAA